MLKFHSLHLFVKAILPTSILPSDNYTGGAETSLSLPRVHFPITLTMPFMCKRLDRLTLQVSTSIAQSGNRLYLSLCSRIRARIPSIHGST